MDSLSIMDKKNVSRANALSSKNGQEPLNKEYNGRKYGQQYPRKRETEKYDYGKRPQNNRGGRTGQRNVRSREKVGGQVGENRNDNIDSEYGSLQKFGSKKQNITHLLNWWGPGPIDQRSRNAKVGNYSYNMSSRKNSAHHKYNKEHFLQANCQFVVMAGEDYSSCMTDADHLVEWTLVEEVRLHMTEPPSCPICLFPPTAAKVTRCGHIYCYPCILHYLALSDNKWRKCPICFEAVDKDDLKSVVAILEENCSLDEEIELQLMRRERDSLVPVPVSCFDDKKNFEFASYSTPGTILPFSKLIVASKKEVADFVLEREMKDLQNQMVAEGDQPEACFIEEAITLITKRKSSLSFCEDSSISSPEELVSSFDAPDMIHSISTLSLRSSSEEASIASLPPDFEVNKIIKEANDSLVNRNFSPEDLDISQLQNLSPSHSSHDNKNAPKQTYYFYQGNSGAHIYLHALNVHMLVKEYGSLENCPLTIKGRIVDKETASMSDDLRNRLRYLRHLPLTCNFDFVEIDLKAPLISQSTQLEFKERLEQREKRRRKRALEERRLQRKAQAEEDRMMGRASKGARLNLRSERHFPSFADDPPLMSAFSLGAEGIESGGEEFGVGAHAVSPSRVSSDVGVTTHLCKSAAASAPGPSFAQMIRDGHKVSTPSRPSFQSSLQLSKAKGINESSESLEDDCGGAAPDFNASFSHAFAKALDDAARRAQPSSDNSKALEEDEEDNGAPNSSRRNKKKKKKKGILLLSSGAP